MFLEIVREFHKNVDAHVISANTSHLVILAKLFSDEMFLASLFITSIVTAVCIYTESVLSSKLWNIKFGKYYNFIFWFILAYIPIVFIRKYGISGNLIPFLQHIELYIEMLTVYLPENQDFLWLIIWGVFVGCIWWKWPKSSVRLRSHSRHLADIAIVLICIISMAVFLYLQYAVLQGSFTKLYRHFFNSDETLSKYYLIEKGKICFMFYTLIFGWVVWGKMKMDFCVLFRRWLYFAFIVFVLTAIPFYIVGNYIYLSWIETFRVPDSLMKPALGVVSGILPRESDFSDFRFYGHFRNKSSDTVYVSTTGSATGTDVVVLVLPGDSAPLLILNQRISADESDSSLYRTTIMDAEFKILWDMSLIKRELESAIVMYTESGPNIVKLQHHNAHPLVFRNKGDSWLLRHPYPENVGGL